MVVQTLTYGIRLHPSPAESDLARPHLHGIPLLLRPCEPRIRVSGCSATNPSGMEQR